MLSHNFRRGLLSLRRQGPRSLSTRPLPSQDHEYTAQPEYPPIQDPSFKAKKTREQGSWHRRVERLSSVEEKLFEINMPKYYGYKANILTDERYPYNVKPFVQYATRTCFQQGLPPCYDPLKEEATQILDSIRGELEDTIAFELSNYTHFGTTNVSPKEKEEALVRALLTQLNRTLTNALAAKYPHLSETETDADPRHEAFWFLGGIYPPKLVRKIKEGQEWQKPYANDPYDRNMQYVGKPYLALRHKHLLDPLAPGTVLDTLDIKQDNVEVPEFRYDPLALGYMTEFRHATTVPGFWPGDQHEFGLLSFQRRSHTIDRHRISALNDLEEALHAQGILSSFAWLLGQACYQGFSVFQDVTYPLTTQTVITNGKQWSFYAYQLNTTLVHSDQVDANNRYNLCWGTQELQLYDSVDDGGKINGLRDEVLLPLIMFYMNQPKQRPDELKPYLCPREPRVADIVDERRRAFMEQAYKHVVANRPRHRLVPEVYQWEKIYKIDHKTRPMDPKRRPFELGENMYKRRMDEHALKYIPRAVRPDGPKSRPKFEATYYPNVRR